MPILLPGQSLLRPQDRDVLGDLGGYLSELAQDLELQNDPLQRSIRVWWDRYDARPRQKTKDYPFRRSSNVVVPLIGIMVDAMVSQQLSVLLAAGDRYWQARVENEGNESLASNMVRYVNWQARNDFDWTETITSGLLDLFVTGETVFPVNYRADVRPMFYGPGATRSQRLQHRMVTMTKGPQIEHCPRENFLWDTSFPIQDAPCVVRMREWSWAELSAMASLDPAWDKQAIEEIRTAPGRDGYSTWASTKEARQRHADVTDPSQHFRLPHVVYEMHVDWPLLRGRFDIPGQEDPDAVQLPLMIHLHRKTGKVLRCVAEPYHLPGKPFRSCAFRKGSPGGVAKKLEQLQSIQTTLFNQAIDAQTRANAIWAKTRNAKFLQEPLDPAHPIFVNAMDEFEPLNIGTSVQPNMALFVAAQTMGERWMGPSDPLLGRDTRSGGHPAPATSTLALLEQATRMSAFTDTMLHNTLGYLGQWVAILDQQFETNDEGKLERVLGPGDAQAIGGFLFPTEPIPGNYYFEITSLSRTDNPDLAMRRQLTTAQAHNNYLAFVMNAMQVIEAPTTGPRMKATAAKAIESMGRIYNRFLDANNVDDLEKFLVQLNEVGIDARNALQQFTVEAAQQAAAAAQAGAAGGGPPGGPPGAARAVASGPRTVPSAGPVGGAAAGANGGAGRPLAGIGLLQ